MLLLLWQIDLLSSLQILLIVKIPMNKTNEQIEEELRKDLTSLLNGWVYSRTWGGGHIFDSEKDMDQIMKRIRKALQSQQKEIVEKIEKVKIKKLKDVHTNKCNFYLDKKCTCYFPAVKRYVGILNKRVDKVLSSLSVTDKTE